MGNYWLPKIDYSKYSIEIMARFFVGSCSIEYALVIHHHDDAPLDDGAYLEFRIEILGGDATMIGYWTLIEGQKYKFRDWTPPVEVKTGDQLTIVTDKQDFMVDYLLP